MTLHVELTPDQACWLEKTAAQQGVEQAELLIEALDQKRLQSDPFHGLSDDPTVLEREIQTPLSSAVRERYIKLVGKSRDENLTVAEHGELIELNTIVEKQHAGRLARIAKFAELQNIDFAEAAARFGIENAVE